MAKKKSARATTTEIVSVLARLWIEDTVKACERIDWGTVADLGGADFDAGDAVREAYEGGVDHRAIIEFFWHKAKALAAKQVRAYSDEVTASGGGVTDFLKKKLRSCVRVSEALGLARAVLDGELHPESGGARLHFWYEIGERMVDTDQSLLVHAGYSIADWAHFAAHGGTTDVTTFMEANTRGLVRLLAVEGAELQCGVEDDIVNVSAKHAAELLAQLRAHLAAQVSAKVPA
jgi:hypothetical protein